MQDRRQHRHQQEHMDEFINECMKEGRKEGRKAKHVAKDSRPPNINLCTKAIAGEVRTQLQDSVNVSDAKLEFRPW